MLCSKCGKKSDGASFMGMCMDCAQVESTLERIHEQEVAEGHDGELSYEGEKGSLTEENLRIIASTNGSKLNIQKGSKADKAIKAFVTAIEKDKAKK